MASSSQRFGKYQIIEEIGRGGMGVVYRARDTTLQREVALKLLPEALRFDPERRVRFLREARAAAALNHPNIATIYELGDAATDGGSGESGSGSESESETSHLFLAMELVPGEDLSDYLRRQGRLASAEVVELAIQVAQGLAAAHGAGIVHRDLKPRNLRRTPGGGIKILDFGVAKILEGLSRNEAEEDALTRHGAVVGTAAYMAPEQVLGQPVDHRCDLFALGVVLYRALTGRLPFLGDDFEAVAGQILRVEPPPIQSLAPQTPAFLVAVVERLLAKAPADRYPDASALIEDLLSPTDGVTVTPWLDQTLEQPATDESGGRSPVIFGLRGRGRILVAALAVIALGAGGLAVHRWLTRESGNGSAVSRLAVLPMRNLTGDDGQQNLCDGIRFFLIHRLSEIPGLAVMSGSEVVGPVGERGLRGMAARYRLDRVVEGQVQRVGGTIRVLVALVDPISGTVLWSADFDGTPVQAFHLQTDIALALVAALDVGLPTPMRRRLAAEPTSSSEAFLSYLRGLAAVNERDDPSSRFVAAAAFEESLEQDPDFALARAGLAQALWLVYLDDRRPETLERARHEAELAVGLDPELSSARVVLARIYRMSGHAEDAIAQLERVLERQPAHTPAQRELVLTYEVGGKGELAAAARRRLLGQVPAADLSRQFGHAWWEAGKLDLAERSLREACETSPDDWLNWNDFGAFLLHERGDLEEARRALERARELSPQSHEVIENLIAVALFANQPREALRLFENIHEPVLRVNLASNVGTAYFQSGDFERAADFYRLAVRLQPENPVLHGNLADAYRRLDRIDAAAEEVSRALSLVERQLRSFPERVSLRLQRLLYLAKLGACDEVASQAGPMTAAVSGALQHSLLGMSLALCGDRQGTLEAARRAVEAGIPPDFLAQQDELRSLFSEDELAALAASRFGAAATVPQRSTPR